MQSVANDASFGREYQWQVIGLMKKGKARDDIDLRLTQAR
jgi:hypothetical protein